MTSHYPYLTKTMTMTVIIPNTKPMMANVDVGDRVLFSFSFMSLLLTVLPQIEKGVAAKSVNRLLVVARGF